MKRVTLREIGKKLGLSHVTISMALRGHPSLPESTKEKVRKTAEEMGYRPDPVLGALNAYRQASRNTRYQATLAWINPHPKSEPQTIPGYLVGATRRGQELGFLVERFWVTTAEDWTRLARTLKSRGIQGIMMGAFPAYVLPNWDPGDPQTWPWRDFPWNDFSAIAVGRVVGPTFHLVANNQFQSAGLAVSKLVALGYRRIGIVLHSIRERTADYHWLAGYLVECARQKIAPLYLTDPEPMGPHLTVGPNFTKHAAHWLLRHRPEAVIAPADGESNAMLHQAMLKAPEDLAVAVLSTEPHNDSPGLAGIFQNFPMIGEAAVNHIVDLIRRNERGFPTSPMRHLVEGVWLDGSSAPPVARD